MPGFQETSQHLSYLIVLIHEFLAFGFADINQVLTEFQPYTDLITGAQRHHEEPLEIRWRRLAAVALGDIGWDGLSSFPQLPPQL